MLARGHDLESSTIVPRRDDALADQRGKVKLARDTVVVLQVETISGARRHTNELDHRRIIHVAVW